MLSRSFDGTTWGSFWQGSEFAALLRKRANQARCQTRFAGCFHIAGPLMGPFSRVRELVWRLTNKGKCFEARRISVEFLYQRIILRSCGKDGSTLMSRPISTFDLALTGGFSGWMVI